MANVSVSLRTPEPWRRIELNDEESEIVGPQHVGDDLSDGNDDFQSLATVHGGLGEGAGMANACLMTAAPKLLRNLQNLVDSCQSVIDNIDHGEAFAAAINSMERTTQEAAAVLQELFEPTV